MIRFALRCEDGHRFDGWFRSSDAFEAQRCGALIVCPTCASVSVEKELMAPAVVKRGRAAPPPAPPQAEATTLPEAVEGGEAPATAGPEPLPGGPVRLLDERARELREALRSTFKAMKSTARDVGRAFPEEARKMHYGDSEDTGIYGEANREEAEALLEEGIAILPLPALPDERN